MNIKPINNERRASFYAGHSAGEVVRSVFYLLLTGLIAADLTRTAFNVTRFFRASEVLAGVSPLDSFSEPATAAAILKRQAESLLFDYTEARNAASEVALLVPQHSRPGNHQQMARKYAGFVGFVRGTPAEVSWIQPLEKLHATVQNVTIDLNQKLLVVYSENHFENQLVDAFLRFLGEAPDQPEVLEWVRCALDYSRHCGRTEEVENALRHVIRFLKTAPRLAALMETWERKQHEDEYADD